MINHSTLLKTLIVLFACGTSIRAYGQQRENEAPLTRTLSLPDFIKIEDYYIKDTLITYVCFNKDGDELEKDTITNPASIDYVSVIKKYSDPKHTYTDKDGSEKPIPTEKIFMRYDRLGSNKWMFINYASYKPVTLQEFPGVITKTDTKTIVDPAKGEELQITYKFYKVAVAK